MNYRIVTFESLKFIGFQKEFAYNNAHQEIPLFWNEICEKHAKNIFKGEEPKTPYEKAWIKYTIGEYAVCIDDLGPNKFRYLIAGKYTEGDIPEGMIVVELPKSTWAIFDCIGPNPETLQSVSTEIYDNWLPNNAIYEIDGSSNIEWYDCEMDIKDQLYHSQVWVPVKKKVNKE